MNALIYLAKTQDDGPVLISKIALSEHIPQKFLEAILLELKRGGYLGSKKGKGGGYYLLKKPQDINVAQIMRYFDGPIALLPCVTFQFYERCEECRDEEICGIRDVMFEVRNRTVELLKKATIAEIIKREIRLSKKNR